MKDLEPMSKHQMMASLVLDKRAYEKEFEAIEKEESDTSELRVLKKEELPSFQGQTVAPNVT